MTTIVVGSVIANKPHNGGNVWAVMNWVKGLQALGCDVFFCEQIDRSHCVDAAGCPTSFPESANLTYFRQIMRRFQLSDRAILICDGGALTDGIELAEIVDAARSADALVNVTGHVTLDEIVQGPRRRVYLDLDPGFTQYWLAGGGSGSRLAGHDLFYTVGENIGRANCDIPTSGIPWHPIRQPVVLDPCPASPAAEPGKFTTVATWRGPYGPLHIGDQVYGLKVHEFRKFLDLPQRTGCSFELALNMYPEDWKDREALQAHGWRLVDPVAVAGDPDDFDGYIRSSGAEFSAAQGVYVHTCSGWFSDRSARYLAAGKPVLLQDTGFSHNLRVGEGLLAFTTLEEATEGARRIVGEYRAHSAAARSLAREHFDAEAILGRFLSEVMATPCPREAHYVAL